MATVKPVKGEVLRSSEVPSVVVNDKLSISKAIQLLERQQAYEEEHVSIRITIPGAFHDGAFAFTKAMKERFGWVHAVPTPGMFGDDPPALIEIPIGFNQTGIIIWGEFVVPGVEGKLTSRSIIDSEGMRVFQLCATVKRKHEDTIRELGEITKRIASQESIYRSKAVRIRFNDEDGDRLEIPRVTYMDVASAKPDGLILPPSVHDAVSTSVFTPIRETAACRKFGVPLKRGILFAGPFGTGKTLSAHVTAHLAERYGWLFVYCERADELPQCIAFTRLYPDSPAIIFCEDIDREVAGQRTTEMDSLLNTIDGIDSKKSELMVILTTNAVEKINQAMLRPGRLDAVINFERPDAYTAERLIRYYGGELVPQHEDLQAVGQALAGQIPAVIRECVERAKLSAIKLYGSAGLIDAVALLDAAEGMQWQLALLNGKADQATPEQQFGVAFQTAVRTAVQTLQ